MSRRWPVARILVCTLLIAVAPQLGAQIEPPNGGPLRAKAFRHADLTIPDDARGVDQLPAQAAARAGEALANLALADLDVTSQGARVDVRGGRFETLLPSLTLVAARTPPGQSEKERAAAARTAFRSFLDAHRQVLDIDTGELAAGRVAVHGDGSVVQIHMPRVVDGIPVRGSFVGGVINHGKLALFGVHRWGDVRISRRPRISADDALGIARDYLSPNEIVGTWGNEQLLLVPTARSQGPADVGSGYGHRLVWQLRPSFQDDIGSWELLVDAANGEVISFEDTNQYAEAKGGVYPKTNDGVGDDGTEQPGWPMPFMYVGTATTDTGGNYDLTGPQTATFNGPYVNMADNCGTDSLTQSGGIDWGTSGGTDCTTPGFGGAGNTHSSRSGFYELNRIKEMARSHLPSNTWLQARLTANMNINNTCNAFWNGSTVNFYRSGGGCANTGEIAAVFDHEWGHGMDANDVVGGIASPSGEGIADIYSALRLYDSCIGRNFLPTPCSGNGDPCLTCTGVRDIDYLQRQSGQPHDYSWSNANCGGSVHCVGGVYSEAVWSLWKRELPALYGYDNNTAAEIVTRLTYIGAGNTSTWFSGGPPNGGCSAGSGYMNYLAADDDNGNLNDGTPHMTAIYNAFNDQEIACQTPTVQDSGCAGVPTAAPDVTTTSGDTSISLSWGSVSGATEYEVFRGEGIFQCDFGKVKIGSTTGTSFTDTGLQNGRDYSYVVIPKGSSDSCFGPASACDTVQPGAVACSVDADCDDGVFCNGAEACVANVCTAGTYPCAATWTCDEGADVCVPECTVDADCDDGAFCNGAETCDAGTCAAGSDPCPGQSCDEGGDVCTDSNGPQIAVYDAGLGAPACAIRGSSCDSTTLVNGRANLGPEPNQPNTLDTCTDGTSGTYHSDESNDRIVVSTLDSQDFSEGATVQIDATVWAWSTGSADTLDLYYAADANNPTWVNIASIKPPSGGAHTLSAQYVLPPGALQAVRAQFRYQGTSVACSSGNYNDRDDLVFAVGGAAPECTVDNDCSDGLFCNGAETCNAGTCQAGTAPVCDDGLFCNGAETCNEGTDSCDAGTAPVCDDGTFCNGTETCNEATDSCDPGTPPACDDGAFCNGTETCNEGTDSCDPGTAPCDPGTETCNEGTDTCEPIGCTVDADCDDGAYCNGTETCNAGVCQAGTVPVCNDGLFCNGTETCNEGTDSCAAGTPPACDDGLFCNGTETCNESTDSCAAGTPPACDDGAFCNGAETCNEGTDSCDAGIAPCTGGQTCNEDTDICEGGAAPKIWMSFRSNTAVPGVGTVADEDVVSYDEGSGVWALEFDGSDVGLGGLEIDGMARLPGGDLLLSFTAPGTVGGLAVDDSDIVRFTGTGGANTSGTFSFYFDGSDVGLTSNGEDVDSIALAADGRLIVSTTGNFSGTGASGADEDLFLFTGTLGSATTTGSFALYFDGSDVGLGGNSSADVDAATLTAGGNLLFSTLGNITLTGLSVADEDVVEFDGTFGSSTSGSFSMRLDLSTLGISTAENVGSLHIIVE